jgi:hypothetical protein
MTDLDKQIELMRLQLQLAQLQQASKKKAHTKNADWCSKHKPSHSFKEWCREISNSIDGSDVLSFESSFEYLLDYFIKEYRDLEEDERPLVFVEKSFWAFNEKREWVKIHKEEITETLFRRLYNSILKKMWKMFSETDKNWASNEKLNLRFMITSNDILSKDDNEDGYMNLTFRTIPVIDVKDF